MNDVFRRLPLMAKLLVIVIVPLLFITYLTIDLYKEKSDDVTQIKSYLTRIDQSINLTRLANELQKERRNSFIYTLKKENFNGMIAQRIATDSVFTRLKKNHDNFLNDFPSYTFLDELDSVRRLIEHGQYSKDRIMNFYSSAIFRLNTLNKAPFLGDKPLKGTNSDMITQRLLSELITYQGIINANIFNVLFTRQYMAETLYATYPTWEVYKTYEKEIKVKANAAALDKFKLFQNQGALHRMDTYLDHLFSTFRFDSSYNYDTWAIAADQSIKELRSYQEQIIRKIQNDINNYYQEKVSSKNKTIFYLIGIIAILILILAYTLYMINSTLIELKDAAVKLSRGESGIQLKPQSKDAIGSLATSICKIDENNKELALSAQEIGNGNFDTHVAPRSDDDILGNALVKMKSKLLDYTNHLKEARDEFERLADFMPQIVWTTDSYGRLNYFNKKWYQVTGAKEGFSDQAWIQVIHPNDAGHVLSFWYKSVETGEPFEKEYRIRNMASNEYRWFLGRSVPVVNEKNEIVKWFGTATDIHDQKLQKEKLEELVEQRTVELKRSNEDLQQFAHVVSHDLKEPLRKLRMFSDRLMVECGDAVPEIGKVYLAKLQTSSERMSNMIDSILNYSVVSITDQNTETIDLNKIVGEISTDLELMILQKNAQVHSHMLPRLKGYPTLIYQLFYNLINNSLKFTKKGTPSKIAIRSEQVSAFEVSSRINTKSADVYHHITVEDNGIGFNQEYADRMFDAFTRLNSGNIYEGTGLGLALCKKIVVRHQGAIFAEGTEGSGATFHILLPANE